MLRDAEKLGEEGPGAWHQVEQLFLIGGFSGFTVGSEDRCEYDEE